MAVMEGTTNGKVSQNHGQWHQAADGEKFAYKCRRWQRTQTAAAQGNGHQPVLTLKRGWSINELMHDLMQHKVINAKNLTKLYESGLIGGCYKYITKK